ncbi:MAG: hypothetical protein JST30_11865 [Armatimonadetes bacterium]|nr:hypothetical protein [Armatimonadota bacterium]
MGLVRSAFVLVAATVACLAAAQYGRPSRPTLGRVLTVGDSITQGAGSAGGYRGILEQRLRSGSYDFRFVGARTDNSTGMVYPAHEGHGGWNLTELLNGRKSEPQAGKLADWLRKHDPSVVLLMAGTNDDIWVTRTDWVLKYNRLLNVIYSYDRSIKVVLGAVPKSDNGYTGKAWSEAVCFSVVKDVVAARKRAGYPIAFADTYTSFNPSRDLSDHYHPNKSGYQKISDAFYFALTKGF